MLISKSQRRSTKAAHIYLQATISGKQVRVYTQIYVPPALWNFNTGRVKPQAVNATAMNAKLDRMAEQWEQAYLELSADHEPTAIEVRTRFNEIRGATGAKPGAEAFSVLDALRYKQANTTPAVAQGIATVLKRVQEFGDTACTSVNLEWIDGFTAFLRDQGKKKNTIGFYVDTLRGALAFALKRGKYVGDELKIRTSKEVVGNTYLTEEEMEMILRHDFEDAKLRAAADTLLVACYTGLRWVGFSKLKPENIGDEFIRIDAGKGSGIVTIPITAGLLEIFARWGGLPPQPSRPTLLSRMREACKQAGITANVIAAYTRGGKRISETKEKWQMVGTHTGRRSFATNASKRGVSLEVIAAVGGWRNLATLQRYLKQSSEEHAEALRASMPEKDRKGKGPQIA